MAGVHRRPRSKASEGHEYDIYKIASDGSGKEINLTNTPGLDDGPGSQPRRQVDVFQFRALGPDADLAHDAADGKNEASERVTNDHKFNDWFPHFSPDGKWIVIISYGLDIAADGSSVLQALLPAADAGGRQRAAEGDRVRVRRTGDDQCAVVVSGWHARGVRVEQ